MNNDCYLITYSGGTCGALISALLWIWLTDDPQVLEFPVYGDSHSHDRLLELNWKNRNPDNRVEQRFSNNSPISIDKPFIVRQHHWADKKLLNSLYPNNLHIHITYTNQEKPVILAFLYFKQFVAEFNAGRNVDLWFQQFGKKFNPNDLSLIEKRIMIERIANYRYSLSPWNDTSPKNAFILEMSNILRCPELILWQLSIALKKEIPTNVKQSYDNYLRVNERLIKNECPWIHYFDKYYIERNIR